MYHEIIITPTKVDTPGWKEERERVSLQLVRSMKKREKYLYRPLIPNHDNPTLTSFQDAVNEHPFVYEKPPFPGPSGDVNIEFENGVVVLKNGKGEKIILSNNAGSGDDNNNSTDRIDRINEPPPSFDEFTADLEDLWKFSTSKAANTMSYHRLSLLKMNYDFHKLLNNYYEESGTKNDSSDFISITKVDNHIHAASAMRRDEMLQFMKDKYYKEGNLVVTKDKDEDITLKESMNLGNDENFDIERITTERLDVAASAKMFHRFDNFNDSYNPMGRSDLRSIFMKSSNMIEGRFFAEVLRDVVFKRVRDQYHRVAIEPRLSIYGRKINEWENLSKWFTQHKVLSCDVKNGGKVSGHVKWMIQIPRLCNLFMGKSYQSFEEMLRNIFQPIFKATLHPEEHEDIHIFLSHIGGFDCVDDESKHDSLMLEKALNVPPQEYKTKANPPYSYWSYYLYANIFVLNRLRESRGLNTFTYKPHSGEAGPRHHLATSYLLADSINHGIKLQDEPTLQYLYYLSQIGLALCPLSNDALFLRLKNSPVGGFFKAGLRVCLGTDDPLQFHNTAQPLIEEYIVAQKIFTLTNTDMSEIARNSVLTSNFCHSWKQKWLGKNYHKPSFIDSNNIEFSNLGVVRPSFRESQLQRELNYIVTHANLEESQLTVQDENFGNAVELSDRLIICGAQPYLDKLGEAYDSYRDKQSEEIKEITKQMNDM